MHSLTAYAKGCWSGAARERYWVDMAMVRHWLDTTMGRCVMIMTAFSFWMSYILLYQNYAKAHPEIMSPIKYIIPLQPLPFPSKTPPPPILHSITISPWRKKISHFPQ